MFQTIGHTAIEALAQCLDVPLFRQPIRGKAIVTALQYTPLPTPPVADNKSAVADTKTDSTTGSAGSGGSDSGSGGGTSDEVEDLMQLLETVKRAHPTVQAVSSGAILSNYQRIRVENVCSRLGLVSLAYLGNRNQRELLSEMIESGLGDGAILVKVATLGLTPRLHLGQTLRQLQPHLNSLGDKYATNICGEGGEYESFTLDCPIFKQKIVM